MPIAAMSGAAMSPFWLTIVLLEGLVGIEALIYLTRPPRPNRVAQATVEME